MSSKRGNSSALAAKVAKLERRIAMQAPEDKFNDLDNGASNVTPANGLSFNLAAIASGVGINQRVGFAVTVKHIDVHFSINYTSSLLSCTNENPAYRIYVVQDKQQIADASGITISDFVDNPALPITQLRNLATLQRFSVLYDSGPQIVYSGVPGTGVPNDAMVATFMPQLHYKSRPLSISVRYNGTASTDIQHNGIWLLVSTNMTSGAGAGVLDYICTSRLVFQDS
jgi:hypothetical protein